MPTAMYTQLARRSSINKVDKSWTGKIDVAAKIEEVRAANPRIGIMLDLQRCYGLRAGESIQFRPFAADSYGGKFIAVRWGTKGGRERFIPVSTPEQRQVLELAKTFAEGMNASVSDPSLGLKAARGLYWRTVRRFGITKRNGITSHGLRHGYLCDLYQALAGEAPGVRGGALVDPELDYFSRERLAADAGHSRVGIVRVYIGKAGKK